MEIKLKKSISELEGWKWKGDVPNADDSYVVRNFFTLHSKPIAEMDLSDIRFLIGQNSGLKYLIPLALEKLKENLFLEAEYYPGDLFCSLLQINNDPNYWSIYPDQKKELIDIYTVQKKVLGSLGITEDAVAEIKGAYKEFLRK